MKTALLIALVCFPPDEPRPRHPLAPSIPLLTKEEIKTIEETIDRLIQYEAGKLKGEAAKKALADFNRLGPEAVFQLIEGFNRTVNMESSCPCVLIARKLTIILNASEDVGLLTHAKDNIGLSVTARRHIAVAEDLKLAAQLRRTLIMRKLPDPTRPLIKSSTDELADLALKGKMPQAVKALEELARRTDAAVPDRLGRVAASDDADRAALARKLLLSWIGKQSAAQVKSLLGSSQPQVRVIAAQVAGKLGPVPVAELIEMLADNDVPVVQAARQSLVQAAKGLDFGPSPGAASAERLEAITGWRAWWRDKK